MENGEIPDGTQLYFKYWGKASPAEESTNRYHLLAFHSLDVAACGQELLSLPRFGLAGMSDELGWTPEQLQQVFVAFLALHDLGKFSRAFQSLVPGLGEPLVPPQATTQSERHDEMGWAFLEQCFDSRAMFPGIRRHDGSDEFWLCWFRLIAGHHGVPPPQTRSKVGRMFLDDDQQAARSFLQEIFAMLHSHDLPAVQKANREKIVRLSWRLAGLAVLADWIGSNAKWFEYQEQPEALASYWERQAVPCARRAVAEAGLQESRSRPWTGPKALFAFRAFTPLQEHAASVEPEGKPELFLLEDVTGSGKTEAALLLVHRIMAAGHASGFYFGLPTMATADQLYTRVGDVYSKLYAEDATPSLVLSHGASRLVEKFRGSILDDGLRPAERTLHGKQHEPATGSAQCSAWLADSGKKAMLADVGVGTVDQALLGVLPVRHQSLRLLGLAHKVLVVDEVHAYDAYTGRLLEALVQAQTHGRWQHDPVKRHSALQSAPQAGSGILARPGFARSPCSQQRSKLPAAHACHGRWCGGGEDIPHSPRFGANSARAGAPHG